MIEIIPAIDLIGGQCVRLEEGDFNRKTSYAGSPLDVAKRYEDAGCKKLHLVDLDGAKAGAPKHLDILTEIAGNTLLQVDFGGGLSSSDSVIAALSAGAYQVNIGTAAVKEPELMAEVLETAGPEQVILSADVRGRIVQVRGWQESAEISISDLISRFQPLGLKFVTCTDISKDGMMSGPSFELYSELMKEFPEISFVASGGVRSIEDIRALRDLEMYGVIIGKALLSGALEPAALGEFL